MKFNKWFVVSLVIIIIVIIVNPYIKKILFRQDSSTIEQGKKHSPHGEAHEELIKLSSEQIEEIGLVLSKVEQGSLTNKLNLTGEIKINEDKLAHIIAYSSGIVKKVNFKLGDTIQKGQVLAVLDAPEISSLQEEYLEAVARLEIAKANFTREEQLLKESLTTQSEFLTAKDEYIKSQHDLHSNERKLKIFGFNHGEISNLAQSDHGEYSYYKIIAPYSGTIIEKRVSTGEALEKNAEIFVIADLRSVWVDFSLYQKDLPFVKKDQEIFIEIPNYTKRIKATISFVSPLVGENTRTAFARVILNNQNALLKPGTFVTGLVDVHGINQSQSLLIKKTAIQEIEGEKMVFVKEEDSFKAQAIKTGESNENFVEVLSGLVAGQSYVSENSFMLKAEMQKGEIQEGHAH